MLKKNLRKWLSEAYKQRINAYECGNLHKVKIIEKLINKAQKTKYTLNESKILREFTENNENVPLYVVDENLLILSKELKDVDIDVEITGVVENNTLVEIDPIVVDITFTLPYLETEEQHIILTYTPNTEVNVSLESIPQKDYSTMNIGGETIISFKTLKHLADELDVDFTETIEWPFEIKFKSVTASKKFDSAFSLGEKIVLLLGKNKFINKVEDYKSTHQSGKNQATRNIAKQRKEEEEIKQRIINNRGKTKSQIMKELIENIDGVSDVRVFDLDKDIYFKSFRFVIDANNKNYEILMARSLSDEELAANKKPFIGRVIGEYENTFTCNTRDEIIEWVRNITKNAKQKASLQNLSARERNELRMRGGR